MKERTLNKVFNEPTRVAEMNHTVHRQHFQSRSSDEATYSNDQNFNFRKKYLRVNLDAAVISYCTL